MESTCFDNNEHHDTCPQHFKQKKRPLRINRCAFKDPN